MNLAQVAKSRPSVPYGLIYYKIYRKYSLALTYDVIGFWRSRVKVTPWFKYVVANVSMSTLELRRPSCSFKFAAVKLLQ